MDVTFSLAAQKLAWHDSDTITKRSDYPPEFNITRRARMLIKEKRQRLSQRLIIYQLTKPHLDITSNL